jgi:hypothetical protein
MKILWKSWVVLAAVALLPALSGCVAVVAGTAGAGTWAWAHDRLDAVLDANFDRTEKAVNRAIAQLQFSRISENKDALNAIVTARTAEDKKVEIKVTRLGDATSRVQIRVGFFGNQPQSLTILDKIKANL